MGDDSVSKIVGIYTVKMKIYDGAVRTLTNVRHVPKLRRGLISLGMLDNLGCNVSLKNSTMNITRGASVVMKGKNVGNLYMLIGELVVGRAIKVEPQHGKSSCVAKE